MPPTPVVLALWSQGSPRFAAQARLARAPSGSAQDEPDRHLSGEMTVAQAAVLRSLRALQLLAGVEEGIEVPLGREVALPDE